MDPAFWQERWSRGEIGFHRQDLHPDLVTHHDRWADGAGGVLVPLCGKSVDVAWLAARHPTVGVELSEVAIRALLENDDREAAPRVDGAFQAFRSGQLTLLQGDIFDLKPEHLSGLDRVWDRAALVALDPPRRARYVTLLRQLLPAGSRILLNTLAYDQDVMGGPPHSVDEAEVRALYDGADIEVLDQTSVLDERWRSRGHTWFRRDLYLIDL